MRDFIYLAGPYSDTNLYTMSLRYSMINEYCSRLQLAGYSVVSPISISHASASYMPDSHRVNHNFWMKHDMPLLEKAGLLMVLQLNGWRESKGVNEELCFAHAKNIPILMARQDEEVPIKAIEEWI